MKENLRLVICLITGVVIGWWLSSNQGTVKPVPEVAGSQAKESPTPASLVAPPTTPTESLPSSPDITSSDMARLKQDLQVKQQQIQSLMQQYDASLDDKEKKAQLKQELAVLMAQYNEMVLPLATEQLENQ